MESNADDAILPMRRTDSRARLRRCLGVAGGTRIWQPRQNSNANVMMPKKMPSWVHVPAAYAELVGPGHGNMLPGRLGV